MFCKRQFKIPNSFCVKGAARYVVRLRFVIQAKYFAFVVLLFVESRHLVISPLARRGKLGVIQNKLDGNKSQAELASRLLNSSVFLLIILSELDSIGDHQLANN